MFLYFKLCDCVSCDLLFPSNHVFYILTSRSFQRSPLTWPRTSTNFWVTVPTVRKTTIIRPFRQSVCLATQDPVPALLCPRVSHHRVSISTSAEIHRCCYSRNAKVLCMLLFNPNLREDLCEDTLLPEKHRSSWTPLSVELCI